MEFYRIQSNLSKINSEFGNSNPKSPIDEDNLEKPGTIPTKHKPFNIQTEVYNKAGIEANDDDKFLTKPTYRHEDFTEAGVYRVHVTHRPPRTIGDKISCYGTLFFRKCLILLSDMSSVYEYLLFGVFNESKVLPSFVGYLEEEAVRTYTHLIDELDDPNKLPDFQKLPIPNIAVQYWPELTPESSFKDLILRIRADEAKHREINHTFANLEQWQDRNPFALKIKDSDKPQPNYNLDVTRPQGWERKDLYL
ncbi:Alternative oxidase family protein [Candida albicans]|uniref:Alternative oxidase n=1 Tax=Candida albicans TaxID=5476 RepID=A0A8H6BU28_CANAX|nr:Alternative oxidase family protein [Candida albicans]